MRETFTDDIVKVMEVRCVNYPKYVLFKNTDYDKYHATKEIPQDSSVRLSWNMRAKMVDFLVLRGKKGNIACPNLFGTMGPK